MKPTIVLGATTNPYRYAFLAVESLFHYKYKVYPIGIRKGSIKGIEIINDLPLLKDVHTITLYLGKKNQEKYYGYILKIKPQRVIFNPGTYNPELIQLLRENKIEVTNACTLILLQNNMY